MDILLTIIGVVLVVLAGIFVIIYNTLITLKNNVNKAWSNIDVLLQKRYDMISKLVEAVKGYMKYEKTLLVSLTSLRNAWMNVQDDKNVQNKIDASNNITTGLKTILATVENYPNLKADNTIIDLQRALIEVENKIADTREFYNDTVNEYKIKIKVIPYLFFSGILHYNSLPFFEAPKEAEEPVSTTISDE